MITGGSIPAILKFGLGGPLLSRLGGRRYGIRSHQPSRDDLAWLTDRIAAGDITPAIERTYPLDEVPDALRYFDSGEVKGKLVIQH